MAKAQSQVQVQPKQYQHNTIRTDSLQMPISFYMKSKI